MRWKKVMFLFLLAFSVINFFSFIDSKSIDYTHSSRTICEEGKCTTTLYSGTAFAKNSKGDWVDFEKAESLMNNGFKIVYLEKDERWDLQVEDFNATYIKVKLNPKGITIFPYSTDFKILDKENNEKETKKKDFNLFQQTIIEEVPFNLFEDKLKFGDNSTILTLQAANTENLADTFIDSYEGSSSHGTESSMEICGNAYPEYGLIMFNLSSIPKGSTFDDAKLRLSFYSEGIGAGDSVNISSYWLYQNFTWAENYQWDTGVPVIGLNTPSYSTDSNVISNGASTNVWYTWNVTDSAGLNANNENISFYLYAVNKSGSCASADSLDFLTKESASSSRWPILNITYTSLPSAQSNCTAYSGTGNYSVDCSTNCTINQTLNLGSNFLLASGEGTIDINKKIDSGNFVFQGGCKWYALW